MPYIGDFLGQLMAEVTIARMKADLETVRIAEIYASHPLLKNMPIPRFRLPTVEIDVPMVINNMEQPDENAKPKMVELKIAYNNLVSAAFKEENIKLSAVQQKRMNEILEKEFERMDKPNELITSLNQVADNFTKATSRGLKELGILTDESKISGFTKKIQTLSRQKFQDFRKPTTRLDALIKTSEIKEAGPKESIAIFRLKIDEEAYEWTTVETDEGTSDKLVIE